jgi:hypothetical protein
MPLLTLATPGPPLTRSKKRRLKPVATQPYNGRPCKRGHESERYANGACVACGLEADVEKRRRLEADPVALEAEKSRGRRRTREQPKLRMLNRARERAFNSNGRIQFDLTLRDIPDIPEFCPILPWLRLEVCSGATSPSIDRINSAGHYTKDNIRIVSDRANRLMRDGTLEEFERIVADKKGQS